MARRAGARGLILKQADNTHLVEALEIVAAGGNVFPADSRTDSTGPELNEREARILELLAQGLTNRQIGEEVHLSVKTVKNYVSTILARLGVRHRTEAATLHARRSHQPR